MRRILLTSLLLTAALSGCDMLGDSAEKIAANKEAEGKAIGGACRHAGRAIEDCYALNKKADKAAVFAGWRDMNDYMRENKIDAVAPQIAGGRAADAKVAEAKTEGKTEGKAEGHGEGKADAPAEGAAPVVEKKPAKLVAPIKVREAAKGHES